MDQQTKEFSIDGIFLQEIDGGWGGIIDQVKVGIKLHNKDWLITLNYSHEVGVAPNSKQINFSYELAAPFFNDAITLVKKQTNEIMQFVELFKKQIQVEEYNIDSYEDQK